jgi:hypothetical protein
MDAKPKNLRTAMPLVTAWIDDLRAAFGADDINGIIKAGIGGLPGFHASEGGYSVGTPATQRGTEISAAQMVIQRPDPKATP